jgi:hypothetical protein
MSPYSGNALNRPQALPDKIISPNWTLDAWKNKKTYPEIILDTRETPKKKKKKTPNKIMEFTTPNNEGR